MTPTTIEDRRHLLVGPNAADLAQVRLCKLVALCVVAPGADGHLRVEKTLGTVWSPSPDAQPAPADYSGSALATLAASCKLRDGESFALRLLAR